MDSNDNIIVAGASGTWRSITDFTVKYDKYGNELWERKFGDAAVLYDVAIDSYDNIILAGYNFSENQADYQIIKLDEIGNTPWVKEYDSGKSDYAAAVAVNIDDNILVGGGILSDNFCPCLIMYSKEGQEMWVKIPSIVGYINDISTDSNDMIVATGCIQRETTDYYTTKYFDAIPPLAHMEKPGEGYLYISDKEVMSLPENTIILGKITVEVDAYDENGIDRVEFYIEGVLKDTDTESPYEWLWNEFAFGKHEIKAIAYDNEGNIASDDISVWKVF